MRHEEHSILCLLEGTKLFQNCFFACAAGNLNRVFFVASGEGFFCPPGQGLFCRVGLRPGYFQRKKFFCGGFVFFLFQGGVSPPAKGFFALPGRVVLQSGPAARLFSPYGRTLPSASHFFCLDKKSNQKKPLSEGPAGLIVGCFLVSSLLHQLFLPRRRRRILVSRNTSANTHYIALSCNSPPQKEASGILP